MKYTAITYDNTSFSFEEEYLGTVEKHMKAKSAFRINGEVYSGSDIRRIEKPGHGEYGAHSLFPSAQEIFSLPSGTPSGSFWQTILDFNKQRKFPWLFEEVVEYARKESGYATPKDVLEFIQAEWESMKGHNHPKPRVDLGARTLIRAYFETDEGKEYAYRHGVKA